MLLKDALANQCFMLYETEKNLCFKITCGYETTFNEESDVELFSDLSFREFLKSGDAFGFLEVVFSPSSSLENVIIVVKKYGG